MLPILIPIASILPRIVYQAIGSHSARNTFLLLKEP